MQPDEHEMQDCSTQSNCFDQNYFKDDNTKVSFYTGLPTYEVLEATFIHVSPFVKCRTQCLTLFQEMVMVLMKLRLNVPHQDLAKRFGVSQATVSRTFAHWLGGLREKNFGNHASVF